MIFTQTTALFVDAYRELNARRLFWVTLAISAVVVLIFAAVGINNDGITIFWKQIESDQMNTRLIDKATAYKSLFESLGVNLWLTWGATILALISTASLFPDFLTGGSIDLYLSKPIGRVRLFATKYFTGLIFVALQVCAFCLASYIVLGLRGGVWIGAVFVAVPLVLIFFSYLYGMLIFFGVLTRSTIASLMLTIAFWVIVAMAQRGHQFLLSMSTSRQVEMRQADRNIASLKTKIETAKANGAKVPTRPSTMNSFDDVMLQSSVLTLAEAEKERNNLTDSFAGWERATAVLVWPLPKTSETADLIDRVIGKQMHLRPPRPPEDPDTAEGQQRMRRHEIHVEAQQEMDQIQANTPLSYTLGTSLAFEAVVTVLAGWVFWRRDY